MKRVWDTVVDCFHGLLSENRNVGVYKFKVHCIKIRADTLSESELRGPVSWKNEREEKATSRITRKNNSTSNTSKHGNYVFFIKHLLAG